MALSENCSNMNEKTPQISRLFLILSSLFVVCLIAANLFETKQFSFFGYSQPGGLIIFPVSYIINDVVCEVWGFRRARMLIWLVFLMNFFFVMMGTLCDILPPAAYWENNEGFHAVFGLAPRITAASFVAFLGGSWVNAYVMSTMKVRHKGRFFPLRAIVSSLFGESIDSVIFFPLALGGIVPWKDLLWLMLLQVLLKTLYEVIIMPITAFVVKKVKAADVYDQNIRYHLFKG